ncbi:PH domain-containing protein [Clostridium luticellarii]|jgi:putative membrane protein|uniref:Bacterial membrane flanked domain protein n=1 Tax=Clostridium luticellarii TaxID=1691940 RepID=A0A2T0BPN7_9CLOT|nr:PH domain-containing protein [Clostridium luticellarii]PRR85839.1 Bacterial membrane flanked domain protein [Clostridium luticellarii]
MDRIERNHILKIFYNMAKLIKEFIGIIVAVGFLINKIGLIGSILIGIALFILIILYEFLLWRKNFFIVGENSIYHQEGVFNIKKVEIPFERINTIDISQRLAERIFKASTIKIDTGETSNKGSELKFTLKKTRAEELRDILLNRKTGGDAEENEKFYTIKPRELIIYSLISNSVLKGIGILFVVQQFFDQYLKDFIHIDTSFYIDKLQKEDIYHAIYTVSFIVLGLIVISIFLAIAYVFLKYYDFKMWSDRNKIYVKYGAISRKNYSFDRKKIKGIHIKQTVLMQFLGFFTMEIESIGYGDEEGEKAILYPMCSSLLKDEIIKNLLGEFEYRGNIAKPNRTAGFRFFYKKVIFWAVTALVCFFIKPEFVIFTLILLLFLLIMGYLEFKNTAFGIDGSLIYMCCKGFNKTQSILKMSAVQSLTLSRTYFQHKKGFCDYSIILYSSNLGKVLTVKNLKDDIVGESFK